MKNKRLLTISFLAVVPLSALILWSWSEVSQKKGQKEVQKDVLQVNPTSLKSLPYDGPDQTGPNEKATKSDGEKVVEVLNLTLQKSPKAVDCSKILDTISDGTKMDKFSFWRDPKSKGKGASIVAFDKNGRELKVCIEGKGIASSFPKFIKDVSEEEEMVDLSQANLRDLDGDGKLEFVIFNGQCVEGPCMGSHYVVQIDQERLKILYALNSDSIEFVEVPERMAFAILMRNYCFTYEFGVAFSTYNVVEFQADSSFKLLSPREIGVKFLEKEMKNRTPPRVDAPLEEKVYGKIQDLVFLAYRGSPRHKIMTSFENLLRDLPKREGETKIDERLPVHCEARTILESLTRTDTL